jgi:hypothetical protein
LNVLSWQDSETRPGEFVIFMLSIIIETENFEVNWNNVFFLNVKCFLKNVRGYPYWKPHTFFLLKICPVFSHSEW